MVVGLWPDGDQVTTLSFENFSQLVKVRVDQLEKAVKLIESCFWMTHQCWRHEISQFSTTHQSVEPNLRTPEKARFWFSKTDFIARTRWLMRCDNGVCQILKFWNSEFSRAKSTNPNACLRIIKFAGGEQMGWSKTHENHENPKLMKNARNSWVLPQKPWKTTKIYKKSMKIHENSLNSMKIRQKKK